MRTYLKYFNLVAFVTILLFNQTSCKQELGEIGFPRIRTLVVEMISDTGAVFNGEIIDIPSDCEIIDHGFVWSESKDATTYLEKISLGSIHVKGTFKATANRVMVEGKTYYFKSFVKTKSTIIYGNELSFTSLGAHAPVITSISPESGSWTDTIIIRGKYFSNNNYAMTVYFNNIPSQNHGASDSVIKISVPIQLDTAVSKISIKYANVLYPSIHKFNLVHDVIVTSLEPESGPWNSIVKIRGKNLDIVQTVSFNKINNFIKSKSDTLLEVVVINKVDSLNSDVFIKINSLQIKVPNKFTLTPSKITSVSPKRVTKGSVVNIKGTNFRKINTKLKLDQIEIPITSISDSVISFIMPECSSEGYKKFNIDDGVFKYSTNDPVDYIIVTATNFQPLMCTWRDTISINGKGFDLIKDIKVFIDKSYLYYDKMQVNVSSITENKIKFVIPDNLNYNKMIITVEYGTSSILLPSELGILDPIIENIIYDKNNKSQPIIIQGKNFNPIKSKVYIRSSKTDILNDVQLETINITYNEIKCKYPNVLTDTFRVYVLTILGYNDIRSNTIKAEFISPYKLFYYYSSFWNQQEKSILFNNDYYFFDTNQNIHKLDLNSKTLSRSINQYPLIFNSAFFQIKDKAYFCTGDTISSGWGKSSNFYRYTISENKWERLSDFKGSKRHQAFGFSVGNKGYIIGGCINGITCYNELWEYDDIDQTWSQKLITQFDLSKPIGTFIYNNEAYILNNDILWKYNPVSNLIEKTSEFPLKQSQSVLHFEPIFNINDKAYYESINGLWEYNILSKQWKQLLEKRTFGVYWNYSFKFNNKVYLVSPSMIYEFDPTVL